MPTEKLSELGPYVIESSLGQGGMGIVYRATDLNLGREVAIKVLHPNLLRHENLKQRFRREARMHAKLMHPNIVTLLSLYEDDHHMGLVMELIEGHDLKVHLRKNPNLEISEKLRIATGVLAGLEAAHQFGMVHRDLKPANVLISKHGEVKLMDFGLAKPEQGNDDLTQSGATVGSFRYMSPEQILNNPIDARTDLYAFGILLFFMFTGKLPFDASSSGGEFEIMEKQVREPAPDPQKLNPNIPFPLSQLILKLLEKNKHERPESATAVREEILRIQEQLKSTPPAGEQQVTVTMTTSAPATVTSPSNQEVARQWIQHAKIQLQDLWVTIQPVVKQQFNFLKHKFSGLTGISSIFIFLGFIVIILLNMAEETANQSDNRELATIKPPVIQKNVPQPAKPAAPETKTEIKPEVKAAAPSEVAAVEKPMAEAKPKPKPKLKAKAKPKPKPKVRKTPRSLTYTLKHSVDRSDNTTVNSNKSHEFKGGRHQFYPDFKQKGSFQTFKQGTTELTFDKATPVSTIILHKASVGRKDFKRGYVIVEVKAPDSFGWERVFERKDDDVDVKVTIKNIQKHTKLVQAVRLRFKTPEPITIGPIDIIR